MMREAWPPGLSATLFFLPQDRRLNMWQLDKDFERRDQIRSAQRN
jgi:hypothetical protein